MTTMQFEEISSSVSEIFEKNKIVLMYTNPEVLDFTSEEENRLFVHGSGKKIEIKISKQNVKFLAALLENSFFTEGMSVIAWNIKSIVSYFNFFTKSLFKINASIVDLKIIERFKGLESNCPKSLVEAINRYRNLGDASWVNLYKNIHLPLAIKTLPMIEVIPLFHKISKDSRYAYYEIEGQKNGRLQSSNVFKKCYNPHNMGIEESCNLAFNDWDYVFGNMDFKNQEVSVLQYLSKDEYLFDLLQNKKDLYGEIYKLLFNEECNTNEKRDQLKLIFLPVMYGLGSKTLSESFNLQINLAEDIIYKIQNTFKTAYTWMMGIQENAAESGKSVDFLGRTRFFSNPYKARNFNVQSPAAMVCLEKLIDLQSVSDEKCKVVYTVHDGYCFVCKNQILKEGFLKFKNSLESPSKLMPGLKLKVKAKIGKSLDQMKVLGT